MKLQLLFVLSLFAVFRMNAQQIDSTEFYQMEIPSRFKKGDLNRKNQFVYHFSKGASNPDNFYYLSFYYGDKIHEEIHVYIDKTDSVQSATEYRDLFISEIDYDYKIKNKRVAKRKVSVLNSEFFKMMLFVEKVKDGFICFILKLHDDKEGRRLLRSIKFK